LAWQATRELGPPYFKIRGRGNGGEKIEMSLVLKEVDEPVFKPCKFLVENSECADAVARDITKEIYADKISFKLAGRYVTKHAP